MLHAVVQFARTWILKRSNQESEAISIMQRTQLQSVPRPSVRCWMSRIQSQDYFDVSPHPSGRCTVLYWADLKAPLNITPHSIPPRGWDYTSWLNNYVQIRSICMEIWLMLQHNDFRSTNMNCTFKVMHCKYLLSFAEALAKIRCSNWDVIRDCAVEQHTWTQTYRCITLEVIARTCFSAWNLWQCSVPQKSLSLIVQWGWFSFSFFQY